jgi:hypothetical protein
MNGSIPSSPIFHAGSSKVIQAAGIRVPRRAVASGGWPNSQMTFGLRRLVTLNVVLNGW